MKELLSGNLMCLFLCLCVSGSLCRSLCLSLSLSLYICLCLCVSLSLCCSPSPSLRLSLSTDTWRNMRKYTTLGRMMMSRHRGIPKFLFQSVQFPAPITTSNTLYQVGLPSSQPATSVSMFNCSVFCLAVVNIHRLLLLPTFYLILFNLLVAALFQNNR